LGARPSALALAQASIVQHLISNLLPSLSIQVVPIRTTGDRLATASLAQVGGKGLFVKELEQALERKEIDLAVHSMKDLPAELDGRFRLAAVPRREDPRDALVARACPTLGGLGAGARVGTSSLRRKFQALAHNPKLEVTALRGNVDSRLRRVESGELDAVIVAMAGLARLGRAADPLVHPLGEDDFVPAGGQGALAVETLADGKIGGSSEIERALGAITDASARYETAAERAFLAAIGASCTTPVAVRATVGNSTFSLRARLFDPSGTRTLFESVVDIADVDLAPSAAARAGETLGGRMLARGASELIRGG
jgi:hydroxymethylbilane synthase